MLRDYYAEQRARTRGNDAKTASVLDVGVVPADAALDRAALAALTNVAALVMNSPTPTRCAEDAAMKKPRCCCSMRPLARATSC